MFINSILPQIYSMNVYKTQTLNEVEACGTQLDACDFEVLEFISFSTK